MSLISTFVIRSEFAVADDPPPGFVVVVPACRIRMGAKSALERESVHFSMLHISDRLRENNTHARGSAAIAWLDSLSTVIGDLATEWGLTLGNPYDRLSFNYVMRVTACDGAPAVLKLYFPGDDEARGECEALRLYNGDGTSRLLASDPIRGALLIERLEPGIPLHTLRNENEEISIAARLMQRLWRPVEVDHPFPTVAQWGEAFGRHRAEHEGGSGPLPPALFEHGERLYRELVATTTTNVLLHGDLHHENILSATREPWLVIDPKGLVGDPGFEVGTYLHNLWEDLYSDVDVERTLSRRVDQFAEQLEIDKTRVRDWGIAFCVLSAVWSAENEGINWHSAAVCAEILSRVN